LTLKRALARPDKRKKLESSSRQPVPVDPLQGINQAGPGELIYPIDEEPSMGAPTHYDPRRNTAQGLKNTRNQAPESMKCPAKGLRRPVKALSKAA
jgi:hypothetical protein